MPTKWSDRTQSHLVILQFTQHIYHCHISAILNSFPKGTKGWHYDGTDWLLLRCAQSENNKLLIPDDIVSSHRYRYIWQWIWRKSGHFACNASILRTSHGHDGRDLSAIVPKCRRCLHWQPDIDPLCSAAEPTANSSFDSCAERNGWAFRFCDSVQGRGDPGLRIVERNETWKDDISISGPTFCCVLISDL